jgi:hypothetical protein
LGLVTAVFGAGAARAVERWLPGSRQGPPAYWVEVIYRDEAGNQHTARLHTSGGVNVEPGPGPGAVTVTARDPDGRTRAFRCERVHCLLLYPEPAPTPPTPLRSVSDWSGHSTFCTYDGSGRLTSGPGGTVMTLTYDARGGTAG